MNVTPSNPSVEQSTSRLLVAAALPGFLDLTPQTWRETLQSWGEPRFRAAQVLRWIFERHAVTPDEMTDLPASLRAKLAESFVWGLPQIHSQLDSVDGATKILSVSGRGQFIESVILRYEGRTSLCVSSQVGCKLACAFCQTGKLGFFRNLSRHEILAQYVHAARVVRAEGRRLSHVVFMGMGEPLDNYEHVTSAVRALTGIPGGDTDVCFGLSARHVTISTSGIVPKIPGLAVDVRAALAVSLHACRDELRTELMPINRKWPLAELKQALVEWQKATGDKVTIEYILIKGKNSSLREARELVNFLQGLRAKVNLIPFNAHPGLPFERPSEGEITSFQKHLADRSIPAPVRYSRGLEVSGGCGQLAAKVQESLAAAPVRKSVLATHINQESLS